eukprot:TRINITY_DN4157_c0_g1_i2.p1 TRINITY_DN4157_c0_g1~~TRINITY_DN4157_c0_g1_i2.p1  ORF type:complete len:121 (-),score=34.77 TRINITY_DN4157_c0_g1_i2:251-613(-)
MCIRDRYMGKEVWPGLWSEIERRFAGLRSDTYDLKRTERHLKAIKASFTRLEDIIIEKNANLGKLAEFNRLRGKFFSLNAQDEKVLKEIVKQIEDDRELEKAWGGLRTSFGKQNFARSRS